VVREATARGPNFSDAASPVALLLRGAAASADDQRLAEILDFFRIPWAPLTAGQAKNGVVASLVAGRPGFSILTSAAALAEAFEPGSERDLPEWMTAAGSVFVYGFQPTDICRSLLRSITADPRADIRSLDTQAIVASVSADFPEMCGPMSGLPVQLKPGAAHAGLTIAAAAGEFQSIITAAEGHLFARSTRCGVPFFLDASQTTLDIHQRATIYFDVKKSFAGAVPLVMYLKWLFRDICSGPHQTNACLIIDDPLLQQRYGFLDFRELLQLMDEQAFATTIAFIPWNWRRTNDATVSTFQNNSKRLSVCVHGCDHLGGEFSTRSATLLNRMLETAKYRMNSLLERSGLHHDQIMVFPRGAFSPEAGSALKENGFIAAVNTEVAPANGSNETTIADLWSVAILRYGEFPIFTRRYIAHGIENFAFDGLLGKPCFIVGHHELLRDHGKKLLEFIASLKSLNWKLCWQTLGNAVCRSYRVERRDGIAGFTIFTERAIIENNEAQPQRLMISKPEADLSLITGVTVNGEEVDYSYAMGALQFLIEVPPRSAAQIHCTYGRKTMPSATSQPISTKVKVAACRYLSEFRDNYLARNDLVLRSAIAARRLLK
jgi:hypothetical protein